MHLKYKLYTIFFFLKKKKKKKIEIKNKNQQNLYFFFFGNQFKFIYKITSYFYMRSRYSSVYKTMAANISQARLDKIPNSSLIS